MPPTVNIGLDTDLAIRQLSEQVKSVLGYAGKITLDESKPEGTPRKLLGVSRLNRLGWQVQVKLENGLRHAFQGYLGRRATTTNRIGR